MRVTRITIDADLGLIELRTGPGGDGDYVLLPIQLEDAMKRYVDFAGEPCLSGPEDSPAGPTLTKGDDGVFREGTPIQLFDNDGTPNGTLIMPGGWSVPKDQAYDFNTTDGLGAYDAATQNPPQWTRGGYKWGQELDAMPPVQRGGIEYRRSPEFQKDFDAFLAANDDMRPATTFPVKPKEECDGNCGAHEKKRKKSRSDDEWTKAPGEDAPSKERHTGPATIPHPITVIAREHSRGYKLTCPALPHYRGDINQYDLHEVPSIIKEAISAVGGMNVDDLTISIVIKEMK